MLIILEALVVPILKAAMLMSKPKPALSGSMLIESFSIGMFEGQSCCFSIYSTKNENIVNRK